MERRLGIFRRLIADVRQREKRLAWSFGRDIASPGGRRAAWLHANLVDHAFLRHAWTNLAEFAPGAWRSNQPGPARVARYASMGIRTIVSLRGPTRYSYALFEEEACARHGIAFHPRKLSAGGLRPASELLDLLNLFAEAQHPILIHCKSGADRAGFAAALYLLDRTDTPVETAAAQLHWRYLHFDNARTGILDFAIRTYGRARAERGLSLRAWLATEYDHAQLTAQFRAERGRR